MKKNKPIQKLIKPSISKLSPSNKNKSSKYANFNLTSFKNNECNKLISSPKKIKEENILSKKIYILIRHIIEKRSRAHRIIFNFRI